MVSEGLDSTMEHFLGMPIDECRKKLERSQKLEYLANKGYNLMLEDPFLVAKKLMGTTLAEGFFKVPGFNKMHHPDKIKILHLFGLCLINASFSNNDGTLKTKEEVTSELLDVYDIPGFYQLAKESKENLYNMMEFVVIDEWKRSKK